MTEMQCRKNRQPPQPFRQYGKSLLAKYSLQLADPKRLSEIEDKHNTAQEPRMHCSYMHAQSQSTAEVHILYR